MAQPLVLEERERVCEAGFPTGSHGEMHGGTAIDDHGPGADRAWCALLWSCHREGPGDEARAEPPKTGRNLRTFSATAARRALRSAAEEAGHAERALRDATSLASILGGTDQPRRTVANVILT